MELLRCFIPGKSQWLDLELLQLSYENESPDAELDVQCPIRHGHGPKTRVGWDGSSSAKQAREMLRRGRGHSVPLSASCQISRGSTSHASIVIFPSRQPTLSGDKRHDDCWALSTDLAYTQEPRDTGCFDAIGHHDGQAPA